MNNKLLLALVAVGALSLSAASFAQSGIYVGEQLGFGNTDYGMNKTFTDEDLSVHFNSTDQNGLAGRIYVGYQFNCYFGVEMGAALFSDANFNVSSDANSVELEEIEINLARFQTSQFDLLFKVGMPFGCSGFRGDIKFGLADVVVDLDSNFETGGKGLNHSSSNIDFALGASVSYNLNRQVALDVSWLHAFGDTSKSNNFDFDTFKDDRKWSPDTDLVTVGISYTFI